MSLIITNMTNNSIVKMLLAIADYGKTVRGTQTEIFRPK